MGKINRFNHNNMMHNPPFGLSWRPVCRMSGCELRRRGDYFEMTGPTGEHRLLVEQTDRKRLIAHWLGFISAAVEEIKKVGPMG